MVFHFFFFISFNSTRTANIDSDYSGSVIYYNRFVCVCVCVAIQCFERPLNTKKQNKYMYINNTRAKLLHMSAGNDFDTIYFPPSINVKSSACSLVFRGHA